MHEIDDKRGKVRKMDTREFLRLLARIKKK